MSLAPKYSLTHLFYPQLTSRVAGPNIPHQVNLYLDYACPFSSKLYKKLLTVIPDLEKKHKGKFQFAFFNVIQPWHPSSNIVHEFSLAVAQLLREKKTDGSNTLFWEVSKIIFDHQTEFYDTATADLSRNEIYKRATDILFKTLKDLPFSQEEVLQKLVIKQATNPKDYQNDGNSVTDEIKYFTKYLRGVGVHVTPTVSVDGVVDGKVSSGSEVSELINVFEAHLDSE